MRNSYLNKTAIVLACLGLGGLLAGFVPGREPGHAEWRGRLSNSQEESRLPLNRRATTAPDMEPTRIDRTPQESAFPPVSPTSSLLYLDGWTVGILTEHGPAPASSPFNAPDTLPLRPAPDLSPASRDASHPPLSVAVLTRDMALAAAGRPLPWMTGGPVCFRPVTPLPSPAQEQEPESLSPVANFASLSMLGRAARYRESVERYARKYDLDTSLVYAIMQTESGFNPGLVSPRDAHGLMQVVPTTAGDEVHRWFGRSGLPSSAELLNPDNNIRYGTAYLHLLRTRHLNGIRDPLSLEYCVIAAYNGGSGAVLRHFGDNREQALAAINAMSPQEVLASLTGSFPARETRLFVLKVLASRAQFTASAGQMQDGVSLAAADAAPVSPTVNEHDSGPDSSPQTFPRSESPLEKVEREQRALLDSMWRQIGGETPHPQG